MGILVVNNANTSPKKNLENESKEIGLIVDSKDNNYDVNNIVDILENENIINSFLYDRTDNNTSEEHSHYYFNSKGNNNTLNSIFKKYIKDGVIDYKAIQKLKEEIEMAKNIKMLGIIDTSKEESFLGLDSLLDDLSNEDNRRFIAMNSDGSTKYKTLNENLGINKRDIRERLKFSFVFDDILDKDDFSKDDLEQALKESLGDYFDKDTSLLNPIFDIKDNTLEVSFNNVLQTQGAKEFNQLSTKQYRKRLEYFFYKAIQKSDLNVESSFKFYVSDEEIKKVLDKSQGKEVKETTLEEWKESKKEQQKEDLINNNKVEQVKESKVNIEFASIVSTFSKVEDFDNKSKELNESITKLESVKDLVDVSDKLKELANQLIYLESEKNEFVLVKEKDLKIDSLEKEIVEQRNTIEVLNEDIKSAMIVINKQDEEIKSKDNYIEDLKGTINIYTNQIKEMGIELNEKMEVIEDLNIQNERAMNKIDTLTKDINKFISDLSVAKTLIAEQKETISNITKEKDSLSVKVVELGALAQERRLELDKANDSIEKQNNLINSKNEIIKKQEQEINSFDSIKQSYEDKLALLREENKKLIKSNNEFEARDKNNVAKDKIEKISSHLEKSEFGKTFDKYVKEEIKLGKSFDEILNSLDVKVEDKKIVSVKSNDNKLDLDLEDNTRGIDD